LPPSSDRFVRQKKTRSLRTTNGKQPEEPVARHQGYTLIMSVAGRLIITSPNAMCV
jgi:hypothetical protein